MEGSLFIPNLCDKILTSFRIGKLLLFDGFIIGFAVRQGILMDSQVFFARFRFVVQDPEARPADDYASAFCAVRFIPESTRGKVIVKIPGFAANVQDYEAILRF
ncbi:hypothetical protein DFP94_11114 [Fontibacillus phaseoli]|uniref:Uncharacterized protein n=1 Tax=Fontibacillus phaseoli TaxID=1416533 RepID=A0A369B803_9BACL|nr:hypothetical protein [Fontibacillus phaseoli]RCX16667.1 hypothetical protein DFP94_11114 [Fontibacillus phaseoli]